MVAGEENDVDGRGRGWLDTDWSDELPTSLSDSEGRREENSSMKYGLIQNGSVPKISLFLRLEVSIAGLPVSFGQRDTGTGPRASSGMHDNGHRECLGGSGKILKSWKFRFVAVPRVCYNLFWGGI